MVPSADAAVNQGRDVSRQRPGCHEGSAECGEPVPECRPGWTTCPCAARRSRRRCRRGALPMCAGPATSCQASPPDDQELGVDAALSRQALHLLAQVCADLLAHVRSRHRRGSIRGHRGQSARATRHTPRSPESADGVPGRVRRGTPRCTGAIQSDDNHLRAVRTEPRILMTAHPLSIRARQATANSSRRVRGHRAIRAAPGRVQLLRCRAGS